MGQDLSMDSLTSQINRLFDLNNYEQAKPLLMQSLQIAQDSSDIRRALADLGYAYHKLDEFEQSLTHYLRAAEIAMLMGDSLRSARFIRSSGLNYQRLGLYALALDKYQDALQLVKGNAKYTSLEAEIFNSMGLLYQQLQNSDNALSVLNDARNIWITLGDTSNLARALTNIAICYDDMRLYDSALQYNRLALDLKKIRNEPAELVTTLNNIAVNLLNLDRENEAYPYLTASYQLHLQLNDREGLAINYKNLADYSLRKGLFSQSESYLDSAISILQAVKSKDYLIDALELQIQLWEKTGQFAKGLATYKVWDSLKTELFLEEKFKVQEIGNMYLLREKEFETAQMAQKADLFELKNIQLKNTSIFLGIIGLLLTTFSVIIFKNLKKQKRLSVQIQHQNEIIRNQQAELRHRVSNSLARAQSIVKSMARRIPNEQISEELMNTSRILLTAASLERHLIGIEDEKEVDLGKFLNGMVENHREALGLENNPTNIFLTCDPSLILPMEKVISTTIILNEWITNSLKYGIPPKNNLEIQIGICQKKNLVTVDFRDNGLGISENATKGMGSKLNDVFLRELKATLSTTNEGGTRHYLSFPAKQIPKHTIT